jgi:hypothetical protein
MNKEYFDNLRPVQQAEVSILVDSTISQMVAEQFDFAKTSAFVELLKERLGQLDVVPRSLVDGRNGVGNTANDEVIYPDPVTGLYPGQEVVSAK